MTGTREYWAKVVTVSCELVRNMMQSTMLDMTLALSSNGSPRPSCVSRGDRKMADAAELRHAGFKGNSGAGGGFFKNHCQYPAFQRLKIRVAVGFKLDGAIN